MRSRSRGFSLVEVSLYSTLLLILLGIAYAGLVLSHRYYAETEASVTVQQQAVAAMKRIAAEMGGAPSAGYRADADGLVFVYPLRSDGTVEYDSDGAAVWQSVVCYYADGGNLYRKIRPLSPASSTLPDPFPAPADVRDDASLTPLAVARGVETFQATPGSPMSLTLTTTSDAFGGCAMELHAAVGFRI